MASDQDNNSVSVTDGEVTFVAFTKRPAIPLVERAYNVIAELCDKADGPVWFSQQSLAGYLQVSGPRLSLAINQLKDDRAHHRHTGRKLLLIHDHRCRSPTADGVSNISG